VDAFSRSLLTCTRHIHRPLVFYTTQLENPYTNPKPGFRNCRPGSESLPDIELFNTCVHRYSLSLNLSLLLFTYLCCCCLSPLLVAILLVS